MEWMESLKNKTILVQQEVGIGNGNACASGTDLSPDIP